MAWIFLILLTFMKPFLISSQSIKENSENTEISQNYLQNKCSSRHYCQQRKFDVGCACDETCHIYRDCCFDYRSEKSKGTQNYGIDFHYLSCIKISKQGEYQYAVSRCQDSWDNDKIRTKCEQENGKGTIGHTPVTSKLSFITYRNIFCAICNYLSEDELDIWELSITCPDTNIYRWSPKLFSDQLSYQLHNPECSFEYIPATRNYFRNCYEPLLNYTMSCPAEASDYFKHHCENHFGGFTIEIQKNITHAFRNWFCYACNAYNYNLAIEHRILCYVFTGSSHPHVIQGLHILVDFSSIVHEHKSLPSLYCSEEEIWLGNEIGCRPLLCPDDSVPYYGRCKLAKIKNASGGFYLNLLFRLDGTTSEKILGETLSSIGNVIVNDVFRRGYYVNMELTNYTFFIGEDVNNQSSCSFILINYVVRSIFQYTKQYVLNFDRDLKEYLSSFSWKIKPDAILYHINDSSNSTCIPPMTLSRQTFLTFFISYYKSSLKCPALLLYMKRPQNLSNWVNDSVKTKELSPVYYIGNISVDNELTFRLGTNTLICLADFLSEYETSTNISTSNVDGRKQSIIITYVCMSISGFSLFAFLVHFFCIKELRTYNSIEQINVVIILLLSQILYLTISDLTYNTKLCWFVSYLLHLIFLASFFSMSTLMMQIWIQIRKLHNVNLHNKSLLKKVLKIILPCYLTPLVVVASTAGLNKWVSPSDSWYGKSVCFLSNTWALLISFVVPVILSIMLNVSVYILIIIHIKQNKLKEDALGKVSFSDVPVIIKLSAFTGFSWMLGFFASLTDYQPLWTVFEITSGLQGFFVATMLLLSSKVRHWYVRKCGKQNISYDSQFPINISSSQ